MRVVRRIFDARFILAGVALWFVGVAATAAFLDPILRDWTRGDRLAAALIVQLALTALQTLAWTGRGSQLVWIGRAAFGIDAVTNAAALLPYVIRVDDTDVWLMMTNVAPIPATADGVFAVILALLFGALIATAPEALIAEGIGGGGAGVGAGVGVGVKGGRM